MEDVETLESSAEVENVAAGKTCPICGEKVRTRLPYDWERAEGINRDVIMEHFNDNGWCAGAGKQVSIE